MTNFRHKGLRARPIAVALLAFASAGAVAEDQKAATDNNGLMVFPNVTVVDAPAAAPTAPAAAAAGMRVQKDKDTGKLRVPTGEEVAELEAQAPTEPAAQVEVRTSASGVKSARLNEAYMSYSVVNKNADGELVEQCVTGEAAAEHALHRVDAIEEVRHER